MFHIQESENQPIRPWRVHDALISHSSGSKSLTTCSLHAKPDEWRVFCNPFALHLFTRPSRIEITIFHKKNVSFGIFLQKVVGDWIILCNFVPTKPVFRGRAGQNLNGVLRLSTPFVRTAKREKAFTDVIILCIQTSQLWISPQR